jgi:hypothetical protein
MKSLFCLLLGTGLLAASTALATPGWDQPSVSTMPQSMLSYGNIPTATPAERQQTLAAADRPAPNGSGNVVPNSPPDANPAGAGASSSATLAEHGEIGTTANSTDHTTSPASR